MQLQNTKYFYLNKTPFGITPKREMTISTKLILQEAEHLGITWKTIPGTELIELKLSGHREYFTLQLSGHTSAIAYLLTQNKDATKNILMQNGIRTPLGGIINKQSTLTYQKKLWNALKKPLVVKPLNATHGDKVYTNLTTFADVQQKAAIVLTKYKSVILEEMMEGEEYRIVASRKKLIAITKRVPANVIGDGEKTINELIEEKNSDKRRGDAFINHALLKISVDKDALLFIQKQGFASLKSIPEKNQQVFLKQTSNMSTGGDSIDFTDQAHPSVKKIALRAVNLIPGLAFAGIDFITSDITKLQTSSSYAIIEINTSPGIFFQAMPYLGKSRPAPKEFLRVLFPELKD